MIERVESTFALKPERLIGDMAYGGATMLAWLVDDKGIVRHVAVNDLSAGRSPHETLRTIQALQSGGLCGADWKKGEC